MSSENSVNLDSEDVEIIEQSKSPINHEELRKIEAWLEPTDYLNDFSEFNRHIASRAPETGIWVCDTPQYFFRHIIESNRRSRNLVCDWLAQLLRHSVGLQVALNAIVDMKLEDFSNGQLWDYLLLGLSSVEKVYCVVDALEEMYIGEEKDFLQRLNNLATFRPQYVKTLMTSRPVQQLQLKLKDASIVHISLEDDQVRKDIDLFVSRRLESMFERNNPDTQLSLHSIICDRSAGLFLCARLLLESLMPALVSKQHLDSEDIASTLPVGMQEMFNSILLQQSTFHRHRHKPSIIHS
ncbi:hypothetical protein EAE99_002072 [Botrytis elliptica]|nr:hypothetical protein EAE99_002072 [Botrytis elliptica]